MVTVAAVLAGALAAFVVLPILALRWLARHITRPVWREDIAARLWGSPPSKRARQ